jgi:hypothetical protein
MRHLVGLIVGIVLSPLVFIAVAWSAWRLQVRIGNGQLFKGELSAELLVLVVALVIVGVIAAGRVSPLVAFFVGLPFVLDACLAIFSPRSLLNLTDRDYSIARGIFTIGIDNLALALGLICMVPMIVRSRWPRWRPAVVTVPAHSAAPTGYTGAGYAQPGYAQDYPATGDTQRVDVSEPDTPTSQAYAPPTAPGSTYDAPPPPPEAPRG